MAERIFGERNGFLDLLNWDQGVVNSLCAELDTQKNQFFVDVGNLYQNVNPEVKKAFVMFKRPNQTTTEFDVPAFIIYRDDINPAPSRIYSITEQYRLPAETSIPVSVNGMVGRTAYETKQQDHPYDFVYTIECWAEYRSAAQVLLSHAMAKFQMRGSMTVFDSLGCERAYSVFQEGIADLTEVNGLNDRLAGFSLTFRIEGELSLDRLPISIPSFTGPTSQTPENPCSSDNVAPGCGGIYGTGEADVRITINSDC